MSIAGLPCSVYRGRPLCGLNGGGINHRMSCSYNNISKHCDRIIVLILRSSTIPGIQIYYRMSDSLLKLSVMQ